MRSSYLQQRDAEAETRKGQTETEAHLTVAKRR